MPTPQLYWSLCLYASTPLSFSLAGAFCLSRSFTLIVVGRSSYQGPSATPFDKTAAAEFADYLEKAKNGAASLEDADVHFWKLLNGTEKDVRTEATELGGGDDDRDIMSPGGAGFLNPGDGTGWVRATRPQTTEQLARVTTR